MRSFLSLAIAFAATISVYKSVWEEMRRTRSGRRVDFVSHRMNHALGEGLLTYDGNAGPYIPSLALKIVLPHPPSAELYFLRDLLQHRTLDEVVVET